MRELSVIRYLVLLIPACLWATPPAIVDGPRVVNVGKYHALIKWRTAPAAGASTTIVCTLPASSNGAVDGCAVPSGQGTNFPAGAVVRVDGEHMTVAGRSGDTLFLQRGFDYQQLAVYDGTLASIVAASGICTVNATIDHFYLVGDRVQIVRGLGISSSPQTITTVNNSTTFTLPCPGSVDGTYSHAGLQLSHVAYSHTSGSTITRIDADAQVCFGTTTGYGSSVRSPEDTYLNLRQSVNHFVYVLALQPATLYHFKAQSTPRPGASNCGSPGSDTSESPDVTFTTAAAVVGDDVPQPPASVTWDFSSNASFTTDVLAAVNCSDLQAKINAAGAADGTQNHRIRIPATANCAANLILPAKTGTNSGGAGKLVLETDQFANLPPEGVRLNATWHAPLLPTLYTSSPTPVMRVAPGAHHWVVRGLKITANPALASGAFGTDFYLVTSLDGSPEDYDDNLDPRNIAFEQIYYTCPDYNVLCRGMRLHGTHLAVMDSVVGPTFGAGDLGAIQVDGAASRYIYIHNNDASGTMSGYYQSDNGKNPQDTVVNRNYFHKPREWNNRSHRYQFGIVQGVASAANGATTTITTIAENDVQNGTPVAFSGATGGWSKLNYTAWSIVTGNMNITVFGGTATVTTSAPHGLVTGMSVSYGGGHIYPCNRFNSQGASAVVTVTSTTIFTFPVDSNNFSTTGGQTCQGADLTVYGPVFPATRMSASAFTISFNSTAAGLLNPGVTAGYPKFRNIKNALEFKTGVRALITGNVIDGSWSQNQSGQLMVMSVRGLDAFQGWPLAQGPICGSCEVTISDVDIRNNLMRNGCSGLFLLGANPNGPVTPLYRVRFQNNYVSVSPVNSGTGTCSDTPLAANGSYSDVIYAHNTVFSSGRGIAEDLTSNFPTSNNLVWRDNIIDAATTMSNGSCNGAALRFGLNTNGCTATYQGWDFRRNIFYGDFAANNYYGDGWGNYRQFYDGTNTGSLASYTDNFWPDSHAGVGFAGARVITAATNAAPVVITTSTDHGCATGDLVRIMDATGNTGANGLWRVRVTSPTQMVLAGSIGNGTFTGTASLVGWSGACATPQKAALTATSPYRGGTTHVPAVGPPTYASPGSGPATDNLDVGADIGAIRAAVGEMEFISASNAGNSLTLNYTVYAGTGETCYVDVSSDSFATLQRVADSGTGTTRTTEVSGLIGGRNYAYRLLCPSYASTGSFSTNGPRTVSMEGQVSFQGTTTVQ